MSTAIAIRPARHQIAQRADVTNSRLPLRAPYTAAPTAYSAAPSPTARQASPTAAVTAPRPPRARRARPLERLPARLVLELRRALGDERVALADEDAVPHPTRDDHLAAVAER